MKRAAPSDMVVGFACGRPKSNNRVKIFVD
jgi:hypothetical protein